MKIHWIYKINTSFIKKHSLKIEKRMITALQVDDNLRRYFDFDFQHYFFARFRKHKLILHL